MNYTANDFYLRNIDNDKRFDFINAVLKYTLGLSDDKVKAIDELVDDIAKCAIQKGFYDGLRCERDKGVAE